MRKLQALVELHLDVGAEQPLDLHGAFRCQLVPLAVDMRLEDRALLGDLADLGERHDLEAARVGEDGPLPADEAVKPAEFRNLLGTRTEHEVIGIAQDDVGARRLDLVEIETLHGAHGAHRHEGGRADVAMPRLNRTKAGLAVGCVKGEAEGSFRHAAGNSRLASP